MESLALECQCGKVKGTASTPRSETGNRVVCYCNDCQSFAHYLERQDTVLDQYGGTKILQLPPSFVTIQQGAEFIRCMRLSQKGLLRWYADCCKTPMANTVSAGGPFIGLIQGFIKLTPENTDTDKIHGYVHTKFAKGELPVAVKNSSSIKVLVRTIYKLINWRLRGFHQQNPFFNTDGEPISDPIVIEPMPNN